MPVIGYLFWLALVSAWLQPIPLPPRKPPPPPPPSADIVDFAQWKHDHPPPRGRAA